MSKTRLIGAVTSGAMHAFVVLAIAFEPSSRPSVVAKGSDVRSIEVSLVPSTGILSRTATRSDAKPARSQPADARPTAKVSVAKAGMASSTLAVSVHAGAADGAPAAFAAAASSANYNDYQRVLQEHIRAFEFYPEEGRAQHLRGVVQVGFVIRRDGKVAQIWIETSSGYAALDSAALETVRRSQPLPVIPSMLPDSMSVMLPVEFSPPQPVGRG